MPVADRGNTRLSQLFGLPQGQTGSVDMRQYRGLSLNQPFNLRKLLKEGHVTVGTCLGIASVPIARISATLGFDFIFIDAEHTPMSPDLLSDLVKTINYGGEGETAAIVRLPNFDHSWVAWALDSGASGLILPHTETIEQIQGVIGAARFSPVGHRSYPPFATIPGHTDGVPAPFTSMLDVWTSYAAIIPQFESKKGAENADAILALPEVDACMIGTGDLRLDLGLPVFGANEPEFEECIAKIMAAAKKHNKVVFGFAMGPQVASKLAEGYKGLMVAADEFALIAGQTMALNSARDIVKGVEEKQINGKTATNGNGH